MSALILFVIYMELLINDTEFWNHKFIKILSRRDFKTGNSAYTLC